MKKLYNQIIVIDKASGKKVSLRSMRLFSTARHKLMEPGMQVQVEAQKEEVETTAPVEETKTEEADVSDAGEQSSGNTVEEKVVMKDAQEGAQTEEQILAQKKIRFGQLKATKSWLNGNPNKAEYDALKLELGK